MTREGLVCASSALVLAHRCDARAMVWVFGVHGTSLGRARGSRISVRDDASIGVDGRCCAGHITLLCQPNPYPKHLPPAQGLPRVDGGEDPKVRLTGVHVRVLRGHPVWPLAFHQLVTVRDRRAFV